MTNELINKLKKSTSARSFLLTLGLDMFALNADEDDLTLEMLKTFTPGELLEFGFNKDAVTKIIKAVNDCWPMSYNQMKYYDEFNFSKKAKERQRHVHFLSINDKYFYEADTDEISLERRIDSLGDMNKENFFRFYKVTILTAASLNNYLLVQSILNENPEEVNRMNYKMWTPLMYACQSGHQETVEVLLSNNAKVDLSDVNGRTALMLAISWGHVKVAEELITFVNLNPESTKDGLKGFINLQDDDGLSALHFAVSANQLKCVQLLRNYGANPNLVNRSGFSAISMAEELNRSDARAELLQITKKNREVISRTISSKSV